MNTISNTAFYCCGIRMQDALRKHSICNDHFAKRFMDERALDIFEPFKSETMPNISNTVRCRIIDDILQDEINNDANTIVITIGAGFDTRPYRLKGAQWIELDEPQVIAYKNDKLPTVECKNPLKRIQIDFSSETLNDKLQAINSDENIIVVIEGVFMYLDPEAIQNTVNDLKALFPKHILLCDLMNKIFFEKYAQSVHSKLVETGGTFTERPENPEKIFIDESYIEKDRIPMVRRAIELDVYWNILKLPGYLAEILFGFLMKDLHGYAIYRFHYG